MTEVGRSVAEVPVGSQRLLKKPAIWLRVIAILVVLASVSAFAPEFVQAGLLPAARAQSSKPEVHARVRLIADTDAIVPGQAFKVAAELDPDAGWHTYYKEPGDAGMPTRINWNLPAGFTASSDLLWEKPQRFTEAGITTYGYDHKVYVGATITPPADLKPGSSVALKAEVKWLTCKEVCLPGKQNVELSLPVAASAHAVNGAEFGKLGFTGSVSQIGAGARPPVPSAGTASNTKFAGDVLNADLKVQGTGEKPMSLWAYIGLALVGGFILNFMPCVLPVISIKVLSFMEQAGDHP
jgi:hypothetical protein